MREKIQDFIINELSAMRDSIVEGATDNLANRQYNVFHGFSPAGKEIVKYMALGRSFDSQLGNRLQRIAMYISRLNYGVDNVPNFLFLCADKEEKQVTVWTFSFPDELDLRHKNVGFNVYKTQCYMKANSKSECVDVIMAQSADALKELIKAEKGIESFRGKNKKVLDQELSEYRKHFETAIVERVYDCTSDDVLNHINGIPKIIPVDLVYFEDNKTISLYEIKAGGDLDSKNCETNADEVLDNLKCFAFVEHHYSYFATCYNNRGEGGEDTYTEDDGVIYRGQRPVGGVFNIYDKVDRKTGGKKWEDMRKRILVGSMFWQKILPKEISYDDFIALYIKAFKDTSFEKELMDIKYE
ncbi:TdeIII family type II restriction endonuclease [Butyrivibrio sp. YAB3001]|uniref:TdeIII family type II restriction endonuclease n=1 Tax=Butyrivibrio sp. YAB3001 TaxID=1520812 RepID=UPI0008F63E71|nr:TdeIII family type II restriction endonuclease [Butyrivibrio sp. YAB3001]SFC56572.1 Type II restriction endonuclease, TdeIII [Butyrivibrio sp. YAB3001]